MDQHTIPFVPPDARRASANSRSFSASAAAAGTSPFDHRDKRGWGIPVRREISTCERPLSLSAWSIDLISSIARVYALSNTFVYAPSNYSILHSSHP